MDDAYIGFRYVEHALSGQGFVFNLGERVEGVTNIGWLATLAAVGWAVPLPLASKLIGLICAALVVPLTMRLAIRLGFHRQRGGDPLLGTGGSDVGLAWALPILIVTQFEWSYFSLAGMETAMLSLCLVAMALMSGGERLRYAVAMIGAFACLLHPECLLIYPLMVLLTRHDAERPWTGEIGPALVWGGCLAGITLARVAYFGDPLPNTFYAKPSNPMVILAQVLTFLFGENLNVAIGFRGVGAMVLMGIGALAFGRGRSRTWGVVVASTAVGFLFCIYSTQDWTYSGRYFAPYAPLAMVLLWTGVVKLVSLLKIATLRGFKAALVPLFGIAIAFVNLHATHAALNSEAIERNPGFVMTARNLIDPAQWIAENVPKDAVIASRRIGALGYFADRKLFDYKFGLIHRDVARAISRESHRFEYPTDSALASLWPAAAPTLILEDNHVIDHLVRESGGTEDTFIVHGLSYRVVRRFRIGDSTDWVLCERLMPPLRSYTTAD